MAVIATITPAFQIGMQNELALDDDALLVGSETLIAVGIPLEGVAAGELTETVCVVRIQVNM